VQKHDLHLGQRKKDFALRFSTDRPLRFSTAEPLNRFNWSLFFQRLLASRSVI
jgi:hypothetical protein